MNIKKLFNSLTEKQKSALLKLAMNDTKTELKKDECPHCDSESIVKRGIQNNSQRFQCKKCKKYFSTQTKSIFQDSNKNISVWEEYIKLMFSGLSLRNISAQMDISLPTAFYWRHKVLKSLSTMKLPKLKGFVEADETYFNLSFKGQKKLPRKAHKRGGSIHKRGISREKVCVSCAVDRNKNVMNKAINLGRVNTSKLSKLLNNTIDKKSLLITDGERAYKKYAKKNKIELKQIVGGRSKSKVYHIQTINSHHSALKKWIRRFNGVATKHLDNYLVFFKIMKTVKGGVFEEVSKLNEVTRCIDIMDKKMTLV